MKSRGMIFSGPSVRALLDGRKTMTRRLMRPQPEPFAGWDWSWPITRRGVTPGTRAYWRDDATRSCNKKTGTEFYCPYGITGDRIYVKETWQYAPAQYCRCPQPSAASPCDDWSNGIGCKSDRSGVVYRADGERAIPWRSPFFMPQWASRIELEVVRVRVERLQEISEEDAIAEGMIRSRRGWHWIEPAPGPIDFGDWDYSSAKWAYRGLWDSLHGKKAPWASNPWVWIIEFRRVK